jgi:hypothetical protein
MDGKRRRRHKPTVEPRLRDNPLPDEKARYEHRWRVNMNFIHALL